MQFSPAGFKFRQYAQDALHGWDSFRSSLLEEQQALTGEIVLYCSVAATYTVLSELFSRFRTRHAGIHIRLRTGDPADAIEKLQSGQADIAVAARPDRLPGTIDFRTITVTPLLFIAPVVPCDAVSLTSRTEIPWSQVPMILSATGLSRTRTDAWFRAKGIRPNLYAEVSGHEAILSMVRLGCGVGVVPRLVIEKFSLDNEVRILEVEPKLEPYRVGLCVHKRRMSSPLVRAFWDIVKDGEEEAPG